MNISDIKKMFDESSPSEIKEVLIKIKRILIEYKCNDCQGSGKKNTSSIFLKTFKIIDCENCQGSGINN